MLPLLERNRRQIPDMYPKAWRWEPEMEEVAGFLANIENETPAHIAKAVMASLAWLEGKSELRSFTLQLEMVALNLKNLK